MTALLRRVIVVATMLASVCTGSSAGSVTGPYLIWFNLAGDAGADDAIHHFTHAFDDGLLRHFDGTPQEGCWNPDALLLVRDYPPAITPTLVRAAVLQRSIAARRRLRGLLRHGDADIPGYDGVIVVVHSPKPTILSFSADGRVKSKGATGERHQLDWLAAFCAVVPPISRKP